MNNYAKKLTIFTPLYNRKKFLTALYNSIINQPSVEDFEWLIVDDGSSDNPKELIDRFIAEDKIDIVYIRQENQGKMQAHNTALKYARGYWFHCVDSDDKMKEQCLEHFWNVEEQYRDNEIVCGILTNKTVINSKRENANVLPAEDGEILSRRELHIDRGFTGEIGVFFKTDILREYPFPKVEGEKYINECIVYDLIEAKYRYVIHKFECQICEYQEDGYTNNGERLMLKNPGGTALYLNQVSTLRDGLVVKAKLQAKYCAYAILAKMKGIVKKSNYKFLCVFALPVGLWYSKRLKKRMNNL